jgi:hypothetical protein
MVFLDRGHDIRYTYISNGNNLKNIPSNLEKKKVNMTVSFIFLEDYSNTQIAGLVLVSDFFYIRQTVCFLFMDV